MLTVWFVEYNTLEQFLWQYPCEPFQVKLEMQKQLSLALSPAVLLSLEQLIEQETVVAFQKRPETQKQALVPLATPVD